MRAGVIYTVNESRGKGHIMVTPALNTSVPVSSEAITVETDIEDVVNCIEAEELDQIVLRGHSYGSKVITEVADRITEPIDTLVLFGCVRP